MMTAAIEYELVPVPRGRGTASQQAIIQKARYSGQQAAYRIHADKHSTHGDPRSAGGVWVAADSVQPAPPHHVGRRHENDKCDGDHDKEGVEEANRHCHLRAC